LWAGKFFFFFQSNALNARDAYIFSQDVHLTRILYDTFAPDIGAWYLTWCRLLIGHTCANRDPGFWRMFRFFISYCGHVVTLARSYIICAEADNGERRVWPYGIFGAKVGLGFVFTSYFSFPCQFLFHQFFRIWIWGSNGCF
jgi:hypothetical protein